MSNESNIYSSIIISSAVLAALVTSIANIIVSILNNRRLKLIEKQKTISEIDKYRYQHLYEILTRWHKHRSKFEEKYKEEDTYTYYIYNFLDISVWYNTIRPLLDSQYITELDKKIKKGDKLRKKISEAINRKEDPFYLCSEIWVTSRRLEETFEESINLQLKTLMMKQ